MYIGRLVYPSKAIEDDDDDTAHLDTEAPKVIKYINASKGHEFLVDTVLAPDAGITHDVFKEGEGEDPAEESGAEEGQEKRPLKLTAYSKATREWSTSQKLSERPECRSRECPSWEHSWLCL